ncbi:MAG: amino acid adenylation domain-containing protein, partial [Polyangiales bacterium]
MPQSRPAPIDPSDPRLEALAHALCAEMELDAGGASVRVVEARLSVAVALRPALLKVLAPDALAAEIESVVAAHGLAGACDLWLVACERGDVARLSQAHGAGTLSPVARYRDGARVAGAPRTEAIATAHERAVAEIWEEALRRPVDDLDASFFALGGSSLAAAQIGARIQDRFSLRVAPSTLFEHPTVRGLAAALEALVADGATTSELPLCPVSRAEPLPLSPAQARMRFLWELEPDSGAYNVSGALRLTGVLDRAALAAALDALFARHEVLRTRFPEHAGKPRQHVADAGPVPVAEVDLRGARDAEREMRAQLAREALAPFDLAAGPLARVWLARVADDVHVLAITLHHAIADGASMNVLVDALSRDYGAAATGSAPDVTPAALQYADYAAWQHARLTGPEGARQLAHFRARLGDDHPVLALPSDRARPATQSLRGARHAFPLPDALVSRLRMVATEERASAFMVLLAAFDVLLARHAGTRDVRVGVPAHNRMHREAERMLGCFVNTVVTRVVVDEGEAFRSLVARVKREVLDAQANQELPFEQLVEALSPARSAAHNPLFQVMFNHQQRALGALARMPGLRAEVVDVEVDVTRLDLSLTTEEDEDGRFSAALVYATDLFDAPRIEALARHFVRLLERVLARPELPVGAHDLLDDAERARIARSALTVEAPCTVLLPEQLARAAALRPEAPALLFGDEVLSYGALRAEVRALAGALREAGAGPDVVVGIAVERSLALVIGVLAILEAGAAYVPLDLEHPSARLAFMLRDAGARIVVCRARDAARFAETRTVAVDQERVDPGTSAPGIAVASAHLAYVLYTSGTTGLPKAVACTHGALAERLAWMQRAYQLASDETLLHKTPLQFDVSVWELLWPLSVGARLAIAEPFAHRDPRALREAITRHGVTSIHFVPSLLRELVAQDELRACRSLRRVFSGGEALARDLADAVHAQLPGVRLDNRYGPTEALINASFHTLVPGATGPVSIGRPIPNTSLRVLDGALNAQPEGVPGELYIGDAGLARGYLGKPALTAERFVPDPFARTPGARMYRSGDFAALSAHGELAYLGRRDAQVKVRGVRIETGELEGALCALAGVRAAAVIARMGAGGTQLVAYVVHDPHVTPATLRAQLAERLPDTLMPTHLLALDALPRLPSGKLDVAALPEPTRDEHAYEAPASERERAIAAIWEEVLQTGAVGRHDDFFELGGHSLLATQVVSRVRRAFEVELPLRALFEASALSAFSARVAEAAPSGDGQPVPVPVDRAGTLPLSYAQERMWLLWQLEPESAAYNVGGAVRLRGPLDVRALIAALEAMLARHEALRTTFPSDGGAPVQRIADALALPLTLRDLRDVPEEARECAWRDDAAAEVERAFDLVHGPVLRTRLLQLDAQDHVLVVTLHHIVAEGWAMDVFARECIALYEAFAAGKPSPLAPLALQYADYAAWQRAWLDGGEAARQLAFWRATLGSEHPVLELPADRPRPPVRSVRGDYQRFALDAALTPRVKELGRRHGATLSMTVMAALYALLHRTTGASDLRIGHPIANRVRPEFEGLIGAFLNTQVVRCEVDAGLTVGALIARVRAASLDAQAHQDVPFHRIVEDLAPVRSAAHSPLFQVMLNVQSWQFQQTRAVGELALEFVVNDARAAQFDLAIDISEVDASLECAFSYSLDLFDARTIARLAEHWVNVLRAMVADDGASVGSLRLLGDGERLEALRLARGPRALAPAEPLHATFARVAQAHAQEVAVRFCGESLTYAELDARSNQVARLLRSRGVGPDVLVGLCLERSLELVVSVLGVLKAGGGYVPLEPSYPTERLRDMVQDSGVGLLVTQGHLEGKVDAASVFYVDRDWEEAAVWPSSALPVDATSKNLAYCIYTSGSTGRPKGVVNTHAGVQNRLRFMQDEFGLTRADRVLQKTPFSFDVSVGELLWPLLYGAELVVAEPDAHRDPSALSGVIRDAGVTVVDFVPSLLGAFATSGELARCRTLRVVTVGGEVLPPEVVRAFRRESGARLVNMYGPTEASIDASWWECTDADEARAVPIGQAMSNVSLYVLDGELVPVPAGVTGELYIGGAGLARGYHGRAGATGERYVPSPFGGAGERLYRTGDLARRRSDGVLEFAGRRDEQVKVRGYRIELGEIEARLAA